MSIRKIDQQNTGLSNLVEDKLKDYFTNLNGDRPIQGLYDHIIKEVERPLLKIALEFCGKNKLQAAKLLGINRNTFSKKLKELEDKS